MLIVSAFLPSLSFPPLGSTVIVKSTNETCIQSSKSLQKEKYSKSIAECRRRLIPQRNIQVKHSRRSQLGGRERVLVEEVNFQLSSEAWIRFRDERNLYQVGEKHKQRHECSKIRRIFRKLRMFHYKLENS